MFNDIIDHVTNNVTTAQNPLHSLLSISEFQRAPGKILKRIATQKEPIIITQRGRAVAVLIPPGQYASPVSATPTAPPQHSARRQELLKALQNMLPTIITHYDPEKIVLFGSLATGKVHEASDIDLMIIKHTDKRPIDRRMEVMRMARPRLATDFFVYTPEEVAHGGKTKQAFFLDEILAKGQVLYEKVS